MSATLSVPTLSPSAWRRLAPGLLLVAALLLLFRDTATAMVGIWIRSETFAHAFLVPPIVAWLIWRRRDALAALPLRPSPWVLLPMAGLCAFWLLGEMASVNAATQFALVALLVLSVPLLYGWTVARALTFPLLFLFFAVPVGEFMVPYMMDWTAEFTIASVRLSGIPVYREGLSFVIPSGSWSVVEACSGVRYLIASFMVGTLFAYLNYRSWRRRGVFMAVALLLPVLANWLRAYMIVMIGHLSDNKLAAGVDHIIYGWVFFGVVIGAMFMIGARWAQADAQAAPVPPGGGAAAGIDGAGVSAWGLGAAALLLVLAVQGADWKLAHPAEAPLPALALAERSANGWAAAAAPLTDWRPAYANPVLTLSRSYRQGTAEAGVWVYYYRHQSAERKLVTSSNALVELESKSVWGQVDSGLTMLEVGGIAQPLRTATLRGSIEVGSTQAQRLRVWQVYWVGGRLISSDARARLQLALNRLMGRGDEGAAIFFATPMATPDAVAAADETLRGFVAAELPALARTLASTVTPR